MKEVTIYTDGSCSGNPGPGGWAGIIKYKDCEKEIIGGTEDTTNNRMELLAAIKSLKQLSEPCKVKIYTDSVYVQKGITEWMIKWKKTGWKNSSGKQVKNIDLWKELENSIIEHKITWHWVKAHAGNKYNERVDELAVKARNKYKEKLQ